MAYIYAKFQVNRLENASSKWLLQSILQKILKMSIGKIFKIFFLTKYATQKYEKSTIELPVKFCIERKLFMAKMTTLTFSPGSLHVSTFKLTLTSHWPFLMLSTHLNLLITSFQLPPFVYFYGPSLLS